MCGYSSLQERLFWPFSFSHSVKMPSCQGTLYQCLRLPTIFFQIIHTSKDRSTNPPNHVPSNFLEHFFCNVLAVSRARQNLDLISFMPVAMTCAYKYLSRSSYYPSKSEKWIYTVYLWNRRRILGVSCSRRWRSLQNPRKIWL